MDATDYLKTPEAQAQLDLTLDRLRLDISTHPEKYQDSRGNPDPVKMEAERDRRFTGSSGGTDVRPPGRVPEPGRTEGARGEKTTPSVGGRVKKQSGPEKPLLLRASVTATQRLGRCFPPRNAARRRARLLV